MGFFWRPYVPVAHRKAKAKREMETLRKKGKNIQPVELAGRTIAASFWGKGWCDHLESFSDFENRLPRGRTYVRNGSVCHLEVKPGLIVAIVSGSQLYKVQIKIAPLKLAIWKSVKKQCSGQIGSMLELLQGRFSDHVMEVVCDRRNGLFPQPGEIQMRCSCPDWAVMCKHVAAVLYGVGSRLDTQPQLLFLLRGVDADELISAEVSIPAGVAADKDALKDEGLSAIFGIDLDTATSTPDAVRPEQQAESKPADREGKGRSSRKAKTSPAVEAAAEIETPPVQPSRFRAVFDPEAPTGAAIASLREQSGLSVKDFAIRLGVTNITVQRWELMPGPLNLRIKPLEALARFQLKLCGEEDS